MSHIRQVSEYPQTADLFEVEERLRFDRTRQATRLKVCSPEETEKEHLEATAFAQANVE